MKKLFVFLLAAALLTMGLTTHNVEARGRYGSHRVGGYTSSGKGSHYVGGHVRTCRGWACQ